MATLSAETHAPLRIKSVILLHVHFGYTSLQVTLEIIHNLVIKILIRDSSMNRFIRGIFLAKREVPPHHSHLEAIYATSHREDRKSNPVSQFRTH